MSVTLNIVDKGQTIYVEWRPDMNVQSLLEVAFNQIGPANFSFAIQYYGSRLGYLVTMIDNLYDNPNDPNDYWLYYINGVLAPVGIDSYIVRDDDVIAFDYVPATPEETYQHVAKNSLLFFN